MNAGMRIGMGLAPLFPALCLGGWNPWAFLSIVPGAILAIVGQPQLGLALGILAEAVVISTKGWTALVLLGALWLAWQPGSKQQAAALGLLLLGGILALGPTDRLVSWSGAGIVGLTILEKGRRSHLKQKGQSLVEFALAAPILLMLFLGVVEFGRVFVEFIELSYAADNVAQAAARLGGNDPALTGVLTDNTWAPLDPAAVRIQIDTLNGDGTSQCEGTGGTVCKCEYGQAVRVTAQYPTHLQLLVFYQDLTLKASNRLFCWRGGTP